MGKYTCQRPIHPGELLKEEVESRKLSQAKLAAQAGISYKILNDILELPPSSDHFHRIAARGGFRDRCRTADAYAVGITTCSRPEMTNLLWNV